MYINVCLLKESLFNNLNSRLLGGSTFQVNFKFDFGKTFTVETGLIEKFLGNHKQKNKIYENIIFKNMIFFLTKIIFIFFLFISFTDISCKDPFDECVIIFKYNKYFYIYIHINKPKKIF